MDYRTLVDSIPESRRQELNLGMFKAYDIRTKQSRLGGGISRRLVAAIGQYVREVLGADRIVLGRDARLASPPLMELAAEMLPAMGISVVLNPLPESTCQFYFSCMRNPDSAGVMFTASHNPGDYIGLKIMAPGARTLAMDSGPAGGLTGILAFYLEGRNPGRSAGARAGMSVRSYLEPFIDYSMRMASVGPGSLSGVPVLADFLCGAAGAEVCGALERAGAKVRARNLVPDGRFPAGDPNPMTPDSVRAARDMMKGGDYLCGFCYDGDGDRVDIMDSRGEQLAPSFNLSVLLPGIMGFFRGVHRSGGFGNGEPGGAGMAGGVGGAGGASGAWLPQMYSDVKTNPLAIVDQARRGIGVHMIRNGHSFIKEALRANFRRQFLVASEESAHYYMNFPLDPDDLRAGFAATENTLFFTLLTAREWARDPGAYERAFALQKTLVREREWPCHFRDDAMMEKALAEVESEFVGKGLTVTRNMEDGGSLDATLMRSGLPATITAGTDISKPWCQIAQRITRSEEGIARWDVVSNSEREGREAAAAIRRITDRYVAEGLAEYD